VERLRQVIVGAHFEANDPVHHFGASGQHDDADIGPATQLAGELQPILAG